MSMIKDFFDDDDLIFLEQKWRKAGLCTDSADRKKAEAAIDLAYEAAGLKRPTHKIWLNSPVTGAVAFSFFRFLQQNGTTGIGRDVTPLLSHQPLNRVRKAVGKVTPGHIGKQVRELVKTPLEELIWKQSGQAIAGRVQQSIPHFVRETFKTGRTPIIAHEISLLGKRHNLPFDPAELWVQHLPEFTKTLDTQKKLEKLVGKASYGSLSVHSLAYLDAFSKHVPEVSELEGLMSLAQSAGWWWAFENMVILTERPAMMKFENGRFHSGDGPALSYPDEYEVFSWRGLPVPPEFIIRPLA